jgi:hypothetical protein
MNRSLRVVLAVSLVALACGGCDDQKTSAASAASASAAAVKAAESAAIAAAASATPSASVAPAASAGAGTSMITGDAKDVVLTVKDPAKEPEKTIKAAIGGSVTLFLPDFPGTAWSVGEADKALGKAKEEVIPGFAPSTNGHEFKWTLQGAALKAGTRHKAQLVNKKAGDKTAKPTSTFVLTVELG